MIKELPINGEAYRNIDSISLSNKSVALIDGYVNEANDTVRRPGLLLHSNLSTAYGVDGLYYWKSKGLFFAVSAGNIYKITKDGTVSSITTAVLKVGSPVSFANNGTYLVMANGGRMVYTDGTTNTSYLGDADAPTTVTHVAFLDTYILANDAGSSSFYWSDVADFLNWSALSFASAEGSPDILRGLSVSWREIMLWGDKSIEVWYDDGVTPFSRLDQGYTEGGIGAIYSLSFADNTWFYLDDNRRVVRLSGRTPTLISGPFDKVIQEFNRVDDAIGMNMTIEGQPFYVLTFPSENKTLTLNYKTNTWTQWGYWNSTIANHDRFLGNCHEYVSDWGMHLVGDRDTGKIYIISHDYYDDNGDEIRTLRRSGHIDHGIFNHKISREIILKLKRGSGKADNLDPNDTDAMPYLMIRWRNNSKNKWSKEKFIKLNRIGDTEFFVKLTRLGQYRSRQYEIILTDKSPLVLVGGQEDFEVAI